MTLRNLLTEADIYAEILTLRSASRARPIILVEGPSDSRSLSPHLVGSVDVVVGIGRSCVENVILRCNENSIPRVIAIADSDLNARYPHSSAVSNLFYTDLYDLDAEIFFADDAAGKVVRVFSASSNRIEHCESEGFDDPVDLIVHLASVLGEVRKRAVEDRLELNLRELPVEQFYEKSGLLNCSAAARMIQRKSTSPRVDLVDIEAMLLSAKAARVPVPELCAGHDLIATMRVALNWWGGRTMSKANLADALRVAVNTSDLDVLPLFSKVRGWSVREGVEILH